MLKSHIVLNTLSGPIWINSATNRAVGLPHQALKLEDGDELVAVFEHGNFLYQITSASITKVNLVSPESEPEITKLDFVTQAVKTGDFVVLYESGQKRILITNLQTNEQTSVSLPAEARCIAAIVPSQVDPQPYMCVTMFDSNSLLLYRASQKLHEIDIQDHVNDQVMNMQLMELQTSSAEKNGWFLSLTTSRGQLLNFQLYPEVYHQMVKLNDTSIVDSILRFCQISNQGGFINILQDRFAVNQNNELLALYPKSSEINTAFTIETQKIQVEGLKHPIVEVKVLENGEVMIRGGSDNYHSILFGHLVQKETLSKTIRIEEPYLI